MNQVYLWGKTIGLTPERTWESGYRVGYRDSTRLLSGNVAIMGPTSNQDLTSSQILVGLRWSLGFGTMQAAKITTSGSKQIF